FWNDNPNGLIKLATTYQEYNASDKVKEIVEYLEENYLTQQTISFLFRYYLENGNYLKVETILQTCIDEKINLNEKFWDTYFNLLYFGKQDYKTITKYAYTIVSENYTSLFPFLLDSFLMTEQIDSAINMGQKILQIEGFLEEVGVDDMNSLLATLFFSKRDFKESAYYLSKMKSNYSMVKAFQQKIIFRNMLDIDENDLSIYDKYFIELAQKVSPPVLNLLKVNLYGFYDKKELQREFLTKIDSTDFEDVNIYANIAISYLGLNEVEIAKSYLKKTEDKDKISQVLFDYFKKDDWEKAKKFIIDDFNNGNKTAEMYKRVSRIYQTEKNRDHELEILTKSIKKYPEDSSLLNWLGYSIANYEITERYEEAEKFLLKSIEISPGNQHIYDSIAWLYFKMGRTDDANEYMKKILLDDINSSVLAFHIAEIYNKMDMKFRAKQYYELTLELNNDDDVVNKVKEILNIKE
ncbi:MAG: hypothetical protein U9N34_07820, partial [Candidatus Cloacimonadota bacterium]|nr:hypothetical protein [Candidatus Cloacimonadota bacterium]